MASSKYYPTIFLERLRKAMKNIIVPDMLLLWNVSIEI
jgi:hypothetical protein